MVKSGGFGGNEAIMTKEKVWFSDNSVTVYHLYRDCGALQHVSRSDVRNVEIELNRNGNARNDPSMRLCGHCADELNRERREKSLYDF